MKVEALNGVGQSPAAEILAYLHSSRRFAERVQELCETMGGIPTPPCECPVEVAGDSLLAKLITATRQADLQLCAGYAMLEEFEQLLDVER